MFSFRILVALIFLMFLQSQVVVNYSYDAAGNRIKREIVLSRSIENTEKPLSETLSEKQIKIYPNPTDGILKTEISGWETTDKCIFTLYSLKGSLIQEISVNSSTTEIDLSGESNGIYLLNIELNNSKSVWKIIKK